MSVMLDIFGSVFIAGMLLLLILKLNLFASTASYTSDTELKLQQNAKTLGEILNYDLRKIGYKYDGVAIIAAEEKRIKFWADMQPPEKILNEDGSTLIDNAGHGTPDQVEYYFDEATDVTGTQNPNDRVLVRIVNDTERIDGPTLGLVDLKFTYYNHTGVTETSVLDSIKYIKTELWVESTEELHDLITDELQYPRTYWEFTIYPRNI